MREVLEAPKGAGEQCPLLDQLRPCDRGPCKVDCLLSEWSAWSECSHPCGLGEQHRSRQVLEAPTNTGSPCGTLEETRPCGSHCPPKCILSDWTEWASCSALCQQVSRAVRLYSQQTGASRQCLTASRLAYAGLRHRCYLHLRSRVAPHHSTVVQSGNHKYISVHSTCCKQKGWWPNATSGKHGATRNKREIERGKIPHRVFADILLRNQ